MGEQAWLGLDAAEYFQEFSMRLRTIAFSAALLAVTLPASAQQVDQMRTRDGVTKALADRFAAMDTNKDATIDSGDAQAAQQRVQAEASANILKETDAAFAELDKDKNGTISKEEFRATAPKLKPSDGPQAVINRFDSNKDGKVSLSEYQKPLLAQFDGFDKNKDGKISDAESRASQGR